MTSDFNGGGGVENRQNSSGVIYGHSLMISNNLLDFVAFFHVASLLSTGVDNEKAIELTNITVFHRGRQ